MNKYFKAYWCIGFLNGYNSYYYRDRLFEKYMDSGNYRMVMRYIDAEIYCNILFWPVCLLNKLRNRYDK